MPDLKFVKLEPELSLSDYVREEYIDEDAVHRELSIDWDKVPLDARDPDFYLTISVDKIDLDTFAPLTLAIGPPDFCLDFRLRHHLINDRVILPISYKIMSHLWGVAHTGTILWKDCVFCNVDQETLNAVIDRDHVVEAFNTIASNIHPGPVATGFFPPIFMQEFWGPRSYGTLDAHLAHLAEMNIVSPKLLEKAENLNASNNWAVVISEKYADDQEIRKALQPLIEHRQGEIIVLNGSHPGAAIDTFGMDVCNRPVEERPYYLLVVGDIDVISMESYYFLQSFGGTGRLPFNTAEEIERYVAKVIAAESSFTSEQADLMFIGTDRDDTNTENFEGLINPLHDRFADQEFPVSLMGWGKATKSEIKGKLSEAPNHSLAFISAHGYEFLAEDTGDSSNVLEMQRTYQGALILDDFIEESDDAFDSSSHQPGLLTASDVKDTPFLKNGILFMHACYSGGTITRDTMPEWIHLPLRNRQIPEVPFTSALSKALLLNPDGPIALLGHINRSYQYNYYHPSVQGDSVTQDAYYMLIDRLCHGHTIGYGREIFRARAYEYMSQLMTISHQIEMKLHGSCRHGMRGTVSKPIEAYEQAFLQYSFATCNYRNYVILGDPMCRLFQTNSSH
jgi:hypothetical protein